MIELAIMIEGQNGLTWNHWQKIAVAVEQFGFAGLYRSDHYTNANPPDKDSLELWVSLTWLAGNTEKIEFGPLVSPISFRDPLMTVRMASAIDDLSGGRLTLGLGAGWQEREHTNYGYDLLDIPERFDRFEEGIEIISKLLRNKKPMDFEGEYYNLKEAVLLPRPDRRSGPPILVGGNGPKRTLPLAARYADEWNAVYLAPDRFTALNGILDEEMTSVDRDPKDIKRSMMTGFEYAPTGEELNLKVARRTNNKLTPQELHGRGLVVGTADMVVDQLSNLSQLGLYRVMLQWLDLDNTKDLEHFAAHVLPKID